MNAMRLVPRLSSFKSVGKFLPLVIATVLLAGCGTAPPRNTQNICAIFKQYPRWYWDAKAASQKWGIPISVQFAIIRQESSFQSGARPPREKLLGVIPWTRPTTAYGYAQAVNDSWALYQRNTQNYKGNRDDFADAVDFLSWYSDLAARQLGISRTNAYALYLAYHEGIQGYANGTYRQKAWLIQVAKKVQSYAKLYQIQLQGCEKSIPAPSVWNMWLN
jgi:hypothetical protein